MLENQGKTKVSLTGVVELHSFMLYLSLVSKDQCSVNNPPDIQMRLKPYAHIKHLPVFLC